MDPHVSTLNSDQKDKYQQLMSFTPPSSVASNQSAQHQDNQTQTFNATKGELPFKKMGIGLGIFVFLCIYTVIWIRIFGVTVPLVNP